MTRLVRTRRAALVSAVALCAAAVAGSSSASRAVDPTCLSNGYVVRDATELRTALDAAEPGDVIRLADGVYTGAFTITRSGTPSAPILLCGSRNAVLDGRNAATYVLHLKGADWWRVQGFTIRDGLKGVMTDEADHNVLSGLHVTGTGAEAIHLRAFSSDNRVSGNTVRDTGRRQPQWGEGIYVGSAHDNWCLHTGCKPDRSDRNVVVGNNVSRTTAESIDVKEGTTGGVIARNRLSGAGMTHADSWIELKGNGWLVRRNSGRDSPKDGIQAFIVRSGWGTRNVFRANRLVVNGPGYGIYVKDAERSQNVVHCDNVVRAARRGLSNVTCRRG